MNDEYCEYNNAGQAGTIKERITESGILSGFKIAGMGAGRRK